jgi:hypothetical protein
MATPVTHQVKQLAKQILAEHPNGLRFTDLYKSIQARNSAWNKNMVFTTVSILHQKWPNEFIKPSRGIFQLANEAKQTHLSEDVESNAPSDPGKIPEKDFYRSFADFLKSDLEDETHLEALGGGGLKGKWNTPDIVGVYRPSAKDTFKFLPEIVAGEVKIDPLQPIIAFGQAVAYRLFAHRVYIAMPNSMSDNDKVRLESLCVLFGIGLVLFQPENRSKPEYVTRVRAVTFQPDAFYVNQFAETLKAHNLEIFEELFG